MVMRRPWRWRYGGVVTSVAVAMAVVVATAGMTEDLCGNDGGHAQTVGHGGNTRSQAWWRPWRQ
jgi:hypothetical protein